MEIYTNKIVSFEIECNNLGKKEVIKALNCFLEHKTTWNYKQLKIKDKVKMNPYDYSVLYNLEGYLRKNDFPNKAKDLSMVIRKMKRVSE